MALRRPPESPGRWGSQSRVLLSPWWRHGGSDVNDSSGKKRASAGRGRPWAPLLPVLPPTVFDRRRVVGVVIGSELICESCQRNTTPPLTSSHVPVTVAARAMLEQVLDAGRSCPRDDGSPGVVWPRVFNLNSRPAHEPARARAGLRPSRSLRAAGSLANPASQRVERDRCQKDAADDQELYRGGQCQ